MKPLTSVCHNHLQGSLFPDIERENAQSKPINSIGQARGVVGGFFEEASRLMTNATPMSLQTRHLCPDLRVGDEPWAHHYLEIKGCGKGRQIVLYEHSIKAYYEFNRQHAPGSRVTFLWWFHSARTAEHKTVGDLHAGLAATTETCLALDFWDVYEYLQNEKVCPININASNGRRDLSGWRFTWTKLMDLAEPNQMMGMCPPVYGQTLAPFNIRRSQRVANYNHWRFPW